MRACVRARIRTWPSCVCSRACVAWTYRVRACRVCSLTRVRARRRLVFAWPSCVRVHERAFPTSRVRVRRVSVVTSVRARRRLVCVPPICCRSTSVMDLWSISGRYINKVYLNTYLNNMHILISTINLAACVSVCTIWPSFARTLSFRLQTSRKFCSHSNIPIRYLWTAFFVPLSFIFFTKNNTLECKSSRFATRDVLKTVTMTSA